jgi:hypothetical protein
MESPVHELLRRLDSLSGSFLELRDGVEKAVRIAGEDPEMALTRSRKVLELVVRDVYERRCNEPPGTRPLDNLLQRLVKDGYLPRRLSPYANAVRELGNVGTHAFGERVTSADVHHSLMQLLPILEWYFEAERPEALGSPATSAPKAPSAPPAAPATAETTTAVSQPAPRRGRLWVWLALLGLAVLLGVGALLAWRARREEPAIVQQQGETPVEKVRVLSLDVKHFALVNGRHEKLAGVLGQHSFATRRGDSVEVEARLSRPAYAYLIAFRPDGADELCFPESEDETPEPTDRPRYPFKAKSRGQRFALEEGEGLAVFAVVVSDRPLPTYREWRAARELSPWGVPIRDLGVWSWSLAAQGGSHQSLGAGPAPYVLGVAEATVGIRWGTNRDTPEGVILRDNGSDLEELTADDSGGQRSKGQEASGKAAVGRLTDWLRQGEGIEAVVAIGFTVLPRASR